MEHPENSNPVIAELDAADIPKACHLFQSVFGQAVSPESWRWKYRDGPRLGSVNLVAKDTDGALLGHVGASIFPGQVQGVPLAMAQVCDVMVRPSARGNLKPGNVYPRLLTALQQTVAARFTAPFAYGFAGKRQVALGARMGFYRALHAYQPTYHTAAMARSWRSHLWRVEPIPWDTARLDKLWAQHQAHLKSPTVCRSGAYLGWRYQNHPSHRYQLWLLRHPWRHPLPGCGWLITRTLPNGEICVVDALLPHAAHHPDLMSALARALAKTTPVPAPLYEWLQQPYSTPSAQPVIACEVNITHWHTDYPNPAFQPGDTDVF